MILRNDIDVLSGQSAFPVCEFESHDHAAVCIAVCVVGTYTYCRRNKRMSFPLSFLKHWNTNIHRISHYQGEAQSQTVYWKDRRFVHMHVDTCEFSVILSILVYMYLGIIIGASWSEPHTSEVNRDFLSLYMCMYICAIRPTVYSFILILQIYGAIF